MTTTSPAAASPATASRSHYLARIHRVQDHIAAHLADPLDLQTLAAVAHFSPWHFHRVFQALTGETLAGCVRRLRLEAAAQRLVNRPRDAALAIALDVGFASAEVFSRAFRAHFGMPPTAWRRGGSKRWTARHRDELSKIHQAVHKPNQAAAAAFPEYAVDRPAGPATANEGTRMQVEIKTIPAHRLAYLRHTGPYGDPAIGRTWERFGQWCAQRGLVPPRHDWFGISQDNPEITPADKLRYDCCVAVGADFQPVGEFGVQDLAGGKYACAPFEGTKADIHQAWMNLYGQWLPQSGWQADDKPGIEWYGADFHMDPATGVFNCLLCMPVRPMND